MENGYLKIDYSFEGWEYYKWERIQRVNEVLVRFEKIIQRHFLKHKILSDFEVKGSITCPCPTWKSGSLAKCPFQTGWNPEQFEAKPTMTLEELIERLNELEIEEQDNEYKLIAAGKREETVVAWSERV